MLQMPTAFLPKVDFRWTNDGREKGGRPKETWRRPVEGEMKEQGWSWGLLEGVLTGRPQWHYAIVALCANLREED